MWHVLLRIAILVGAIYYFYKLFQRIRYLAAGQARSPNSEKFKRESSDDPYEILGVSRDASKQEITQAYKRKLAEYHPDKVEHLGNELKELAKHKTREIIQAYDSIKG